MIIIMTILIIIIILITTNSHQYDHRDLKHVKGALPNYVKGALSNYVKGCSSLSNYVKGASLGDSHPRVDTLSRDVGQRGTINLLYNLHH